MTTRIVPNLIIPVGIPGSGKSTWTKQFFECYKHVSTDAIRWELFGSLITAHDAETKEANNERVFGLFHSEISTLLAHNINVVADATNLNPEARQRLRSIAERHGARTHLVLFKNLMEAIQRNAEREPKDCVPEPAMAYMVAKYWDTLSRLPYETYNSMTLVESFR